MIKRSGKQLLVVCLVLVFMALACSRDDVPEERQEAGRSAAAGIREETGPEATSVTTMATAKPST